MSATPTARPASQGTTSQSSPTPLTPESVGFGASAPREGPILFDGESVRAILRGDKTETRRVIPWKRYTDSPDDIARALEVERYERYPDGSFRAVVWADDCDESFSIRSPYGGPGDLLWVREAWQARTDGTMGAGMFADEHGRGIWYEDVPKPFRREDAFGSVYFKADYSAFWLNADGYDIETQRRVGRKWRTRRAEDHGTPPRWKPPIHMPRWVSRLTLRVTDVRVERLQDMGLTDALAEGITLDDPSRAIYEEGYERQLQAARHRFGRRWDKINAKRGYAWATNPYVWVVSFEVQA